MNLQEMEPEYILDSLSVKKYPQWDHSKMSNQTLLDQVEARLKELSKLVDICTITCISIQSSLAQFQESREEL